VCIMTASGSGKGGRPVGLPKTGGRTKGTPNRATSALNEKLEVLGCDPVEGLVKIAQNPNTPVALKVNIFENLLPYVYPKRKSLADSAEGVGGVAVPSMTPEEAMECALYVIAHFGPGAQPQCKNVDLAIEGEAPFSPAEGGHGE